MDKKNDEVVESHIKGTFPLLNSDSAFKITSPIDSNYNCIAWAYNVSNKWMWPSSLGHKLDGYTYWPEGAENDENINAFIAAFKLKEYEVCDSWEYEAGYQKIALYTKNGKCTHAAREIVGDVKNQGVWTSKLGESHDIRHSNPYSIEGNIYGTVYCIMKRPFP